MRSQNSPGDFSSGLFFYPVHVLTLAGLVIS